MHVFIKMCFDDRLKHAKDNIEELCSESQKKTKKTKPNPRLKVNSARTKIANKACLLATIAIFQL